MSLLRSLIRSSRALLWAVSFGALICISTLASAQAGSSNAQKIQDLQKQLDLMKAQMENLQTQIRDLSQSEQVVPTPAPAVQGATNPAAAQPQSPTQAQNTPQAPSRKVGEATASYQTDSQDPIAAPRVDNAPLDPRYPGYFRLMGTDTFLRIGGYFKTDFIYDLKPAGNSESFIPSTFPIPAPPGVNNTTVSIRPTRMNLDFLVPVKSSSVRFFIEFDLFGTNATTPRLRHAYAQANNFLLGQSFSNFMDPDSGPDTLAFQGPNSQVSIRNPQLRYTIPLKEKEQPELLGREGILGCFLHDSNV